MIILKNLRRRLVAYEIPVALGGGEVHHVGATVRTAKGDVGLMVHKRTLPSTITLTAAGTPGSESDPLDDAVLAAPQIAAALATQPPQLLAVHLPASPAPASDEAAPLAPQES